jgi:hypothetical protein
VCGCISVYAGWTNGINRRGHISSWTYFFMADRTARASCVSLHGSPAWTPALLLVVTVSRDPGLALATSEELAWRTFFVALLSLSRCSGHGQLVHLMRCFPSGQQKMSS